MAYEKAGSYKGGLWLVKHGESSALVWGRRNLPAEGHGYQYYWLGSNYKQAKGRFEGGVGALGFDAGNVQWSDQLWREAIGKGVSSNVTNPGGFSLANALAYGAAGIAALPLVAPLTTGAAAGGGADAAAGGASGDAAAGGAAGGGATAAGASALTKALTDTAIVAGITALIQGYGLRLGEIIAGGLLILFGLVTLARGGQPPSLPHPAV